MSLGNNLMNDDLFGTLKWTFRDHWEGVANFEHSSSYGAALDEKDAPPAAGEEEI